MGVSATNSNRRLSSWDHVSPGYLETMGQQILRGRTITEADTASTPAVVVVDETFVKKFFKPGEEPLGAHFGLDLPKYSATYEIVGVVKDANYTDPTGYWKRPFVLRAAGATGAL